VVRGYILVRCYMVISLEIYKGYFIVTRNVMHWDGKADRKECLHPALLCFSFATIAKKSN